MSKIFVIAMLSLGVVGCASQTVPKNPPLVSYNQKNWVAVNASDFVPPKAKTKGLVQVRFTKTIVPTNGGNYNAQEQTLSPEPQVKKYIATIGYEYVKTPAVDDVRLVNPFGFTVISYRVDEEFGS